MRVALAGFIFSALVACREEEKPLLPGLPLNVVSIKLQKSYRSNSETMIANGVNAVKVNVTYLDVDQYALPVTDYAMQVWVNGKVQLFPPYEFTTTEPGPYTFSMRTRDGEIFSDRIFTINALAVQQFPSYRLPVVFHYFNPDQQPLTQVRKSSIVRMLTDSLSVINSAFANRRGSEDPNAVDSKIEFYLAERDPFGNKLTNPGFDFIHAPGMTSDFDDIIKHVQKGHFWIPSKYINVWIVDLDGLGGFAFYPEYTTSASGFPSVFYGTFLSRHVADHLPGLTLTHEFGHMLDVWHVFSTECYDNDQCKDTRAYRRDPERLFAAVGVVRTSCDYELFAATNYMDYSFTENTTFTLNQVQRMHYALAASPFLPTSRNMNAAGRTGRAAVNSPGMAIDLRTPVID